MPLRNLFYLSEFALGTGGKVKTQQRILANWLKPLWVLPRAWCVTETLQAKGVPRHKTAAFVRLHLARLSPFVDGGVYACRVGDLVHLWFWENQRVRDFCLTHQLDFTTINLAPESVCLPKLRDGAVLHRCIEGVEAQLWYKGMLQDSAWWPKLIKNEDWQAWLPSATALGSGRTMPVAWPEDLPQMDGGLRQRTSANLQKPWAANLLGEKWWRGIKEMRSGLFFKLSGGIFLGLAGYWFAQWWYLQHALHQVDHEIATLSIRVDPIFAARSKALAYLQWTSKTATLHQKTALNETLRILTPVLLQQEVALRELEYGDGELRLILVPVNSELNITAIIQQFEAIPNLANIRLLPESDTRTLRISAKIKPLGVAGSAAVSPVPLERGSAGKNTTPADKAIAVQSERTR